MKSILVLNLNVVDMVSRLIIKLTVVRTLTVSLCFVAAVERLPILGPVKNQRFLTIGKTVDSVQTVYRISLRKVAVSTLNVSVILKFIGGVVKQPLPITGVQAAL